MGRAFEDDCFSCSGGLYNWTHQSGISETIVIRDWLQRSSEKNRDVYRDCSRVRDSGTDRRHGAA